MLNTVAHHLHHFTVIEPAAVHVVHEAGVPNPNWLRPLTPCADQMAFGDALLAAHPFLLIPSAVIPQSWNLLVKADLAMPLTAVPASERLRSIRAYASPDEIGTGNKWFNFASP